MTDWLRIFWNIGARCARHATEYLDPRETKKIGRGAGGDETIQLDRDLEKIAFAALRRAGNVRIVSEEIGIVEYGTPRCTVVLDPLDGSRNAMRGIPFFTISLALLDGASLGTVRAGYVRHLLQKDEFWALRGAGSFRNGTRTHTSRSRQLAMLGFEPYPLEGRVLAGNMRVLAHATRARALGSVAAGLCLAATGAFDAHVCLWDGLRTLDVAAGKLIAEEAGCIVTDAYGRSIDHLAVDIKTRSSTVCAPPRLHRKVIEWIGWR